MGDLRFGVMGCGFWAPYQIAGWMEVGGVELVAVYNRTRSKAEAVAQRFGLPAVYDDVQAMLDSQKLDFVDIITDVDTHARFTLMAAERDIPVICQKPMAPDLATAEKMVATCRERGVPFMIHENWRWQTPIRALKQAMVESGIGRPFRGHILYANSFPVFANQPFLKELEQFILTDMGSHILDVARFLFGDASRLYCQTTRANPGIKGEDVATVMMEMGEGVMVTCELSYASRLEHERFPEAYIRVECEHGSVELGPDYWVRVTEGNETIASRHAPPRYAWAEPSHDLVHASIVPCNADLLHSLRTGEPAETSGEDNLKTVRLVFAAYESAATGRSVEL